MTTREWLLPELDHEIAITRVVLERIPDALFDWRPDPRAFSMGALATHLATIPSWGAAILNGPSYDAGTVPAEIAALPGRQDVLALFDRHAAAMRQAIIDTADANLSQKWALKRGDRVLMTMPRFAALRRFILNHLVHHRGQMTVYLKMQQIPVPPIYGASGDEPL